jgi:trimethylamine---corrinoid protein Co-methyltransferase
MFSTQHKLRHFETAFWETPLDFGPPWKARDEQAGKDSARRANARWKAVLADYGARPLDPDIDETLRDHITRRRDAVPDMWY